MTRDRKELEHFLSQQHLARSLTLSEIGTLLEYTECVEFNKDDLIADVGEVGEALFFVLSGEVTLVHVNGKNEVEVGRMLAGELMGEMSFFDREPRSARLKARKKQTEVLRMSRAMYKRLRVEHPYIAVNVLEQAIISLDHLVRRMGKSAANLSGYLFASGGRH